MSKLILFFLNKVSRFVIAVFIGLALGILYGFALESLLGINDALRDWIAYGVCMGAIMGIIGSQNSLHVLYIGILILIGAAIAGGINGFQSGGFGKMISNSAGMLYAAGFFMAILIISINGSMTFLKNRKWALS